MRKEEFDKFLELQDRDEKNKKEVFLNKLYKFILILGYFWTFFLICNYFNIFNDLFDLIFNLLNWIGNFFLPSIWKIIVICSSASILYVVIHIFFKIKKLVK